MARLPTPGQDDGTWGTLLNDYLKQSHDTSGNLKANSVGSSQLQPGSVNAAAIATDAVTSAAIADNAITAAQLANDAVTASAIQDGSIAEAQLDSSVQTKLNQGGTIQDGAITNSKLQNGAVSTSKLAAGAVTSNEISDETITNTDIAPTAAIAQSKIANLGNDLSNKVSKSGDAITGNLTIGTPASTAGSVATVDATQTLTNKTLTSPVIPGAGTGTAVLQYSNTTSNGTFLLPGYSGTQTMVTADATQSLSNKRLISPNIRGTAVVALTDGASIATDAFNGNIFTVTLGGNRTIANPTNPTSGQKITYQLRQDATGGRTVTWGTAFRFGTSIPQPGLTATPNKTDYIGFMYNAIDSTWDCMAVSFGY